MARSYARPYEGLKVLDLSQGLAGPYCGMLLALYGADVVKIEPPAGDWARKLGTLFGGHSSLDVVGNLGKKSLAVDMRTEAGRRLVRKLAVGADVVLESFRPGVVDRLGVGYADLRRDNPRVIYVSVSGFGQQGPGADRPGSDTVIQAFSGIMAINRDSNGKPNRTGFLTVDSVTALYAFQAVAAALFAREQLSEGRHIDVSLMQATAAFLAPKIVEGFFEGDQPRQLNAPAGSYRTADGWIAITLTKEEHFGALCAAMERADLADDPRYASFVLRADNLAILSEQVQTSLLTRPTAEWINRLSERDVLCSRINSVNDWLNDPHVVATQGAIGVPLPDGSNAPVASVPGADMPAADEDRAHLPEIGGDGRAVLRAAGLSEEEIAELVHCGAVMLDPKRAER